MQRPPVPGDNGMLDFALAILSGALLALSFPRFGHPAFAWIALVPLLVALARRQPPLRAFYLGLTTGLLYFIGTIYWTGTVVRQFGGLAMPVALLAMLLLAAYLALFPALTALITARLVNRAGTRALLLMPAAWVATEYCARLPVRRFPLGAARQQPGDRAAGGAAGQRARRVRTVGAGGVRECRARVCRAVPGAPADRSRSPRRLSLLAAVGGWGAWRVADGTLTRDGTPLRVGLIQGNIAQEDKWKPGEARRIFTTYIAMTRDAVRRGAEFVIWPESSTPFMFEEDDDRRGGATGAGARSARADSLRQRPGGSQRQHAQALQRGLPRDARRGDRGGLPQDAPRAVRRVHSRESSWLYFVSPLVERIAEFAPGASMVMLPVGRAPDQHRHLLRGRLPVAHPRGGRSTAASC